MRRYQRGRFPVLHSRVPHPWGNHWVSLSYIFPIKPPFYLSRVHGFHFLGAEEKRKEKRLWLSYRREQIELWEEKIGLLERTTSGICWWANTRGNSCFLTLSRRRLSLSPRKVSSVLVTLALTGHSISLPPEVLQLLLGGSSLRGRPIYKHTPGFIAAGL